MTKDSLIKMINDSIENAKEIRFELMTGDNNSVSTSFIPSDMDDGDNNVIIYRGNDIFVVGGDIVQDDDGAFICNEPYTTVVISNENAAVCY